MKVPKPTFNDNGVVLEKKDGHRIAYYALWRGGRWAMTCGSFHRRNLFPGDVGPVMDDMITTLFSLNFRRFLVCDAFRTLGNLLREAEYKREEFFGIEIVVDSEETVWYQKIYNQGMIPSDVLHGIGTVEENGCLTKGYVAILRVYSEDMEESFPIIEKGNTIKEAWGAVYSHEIPKNLCFRNDGGRRECWSYTEIMKLARKDDITTNEK